MIENSDTNMKNKKKKGFTLIEIVIATAIFLSATAISSGIFVSTIKKNTKIIYMQKVQNEIRFVMEAISREMRLGSVNYAESLRVGSEGPFHTLAIKDNLGNDIYFRKSTDVVQIKYGDGFWGNLTTDNIIVDSMNFYLRPDTNPFSQEDPLFIYPIVTIQLNARYNKDGEMDGIIKVQTSITSREYQREND